MRFHRSLFVVGALAGLLACSGPSVHYDYDARTNFTRYRSYDWLAAPRGVAPQGGGFDNAIMRGRVQTAVDRELAAKGYGRDVATDPDFLVTYYPLGKSYRSHPAHLGVGFGMGPLGLGVAGPVGSPKVETEGSIVLEIQDYQSKVVVWKATAEDVLQSSDSPEESDRAVADAVKALLQRFPPGKN